MSWLCSRYTYPTMYDAQYIFTARKRGTSQCLVCVPGIRTLQCMMLKIVLLLGIEVHDNVSFEGLVEPPEDQNESK